MVQRINVINTYYTMTCQKILVPSGFLGTFFNGNFL